MANSYFNTPKFQKQVIIPIIHQNVANLHKVRFAPFAVILVLTIVKFQIPYWKFEITIGII